MVGPASLGAPASASGAAVPPGAVVPSGPAPAGVLTGRAVALGRLLRLAASGSQTLCETAHGDYLLILNMRERRSPSTSA